MLLVARKNLFSERIRLAISVGGVALSVILIGIPLSLNRGWVPARQLAQIDPAMVFKG